MSKRLEWSARTGRGLLASEEYYAEYSQLIADRVIAEIRRSVLQRLTPTPRSADVAKHPVRWNW